jgi:hypothetical protein
VLVLFAQAAHADDHDGKKRQADGGQSDDERGCDQQVHGCSVSTSLCRQAGRWLVPYTPVNINPMFLLISLIPISWPFQTTWLGRIFLNS